MENEYQPLFWVILMNSGRETSSLISDKYGTVGDI